MEPMGIKAATASLLALSNSSQLISSNIFLSNIVLLLAGNEIHESAL
jgi:hypothetical protein